MKEIFPELSVAIYFGPKLNMWRKVSKGWPLSVTGRGHCIAPLPHTHKSATVCNRSVTASAFVMKIPEVRGVLWQALQLLIKTIDSSPHWFRTKRFRIIGKHVVTYRCDTDQYFVTRRKRKQRFWRRRLPPRVSNRNFRKPCSIITANRRVIPAEFQQKR